MLADIDSRRRSTQGIVVCCLNHIFTTLFADIFILVADQNLV